MGLGAHTVPSLLGLGSWGDMRALLDCASSKLISAGIDLLPSCTPSTAKCWEGAEG